MNTWFDTPTLAAYVRAKRGQRNLREVAAEIGTVSPSTLSRIERGLAPDIQTFLLLCDWLEQPTSTFIRTDDALHNPHEPEDSPQLIEQALRADGVLPAHVIDAFLTVIRAVRSS